MSTIRSQAGWFKSSFSASSNNCVQIRFDDDQVLVRDSKYIGPAANQPIIAIPAGDWNCFLDLVAGGEERR